YASQRIAGTADHRNFRWPGRSHRPPPARRHGRGSRVLLAQRTHHRGARSCAWRRAPGGRTRGAGDSRIRTAGDQEGGCRHRKRDQGAGAGHGRPAAAPAARATTRRRRRRGRLRAHLRHGRRRSGEAGSTERRPRRSFTGPRAATEPCASPRANRRMITRVRGTLTARGLDRIEVMTAAGVAYELHIPLGVLELLPRVGEAVDLHTALVVKEDAWLLYGFATERDRALFNTVTSASGVGPALGLGLISALGSTRLVRAIRDRDLTTLQTAPRVGRKIAERLCVELADRMKDFADGDTPAPQEALDGGAADAA